MSQTVWVAPDVSSELTLVLGDPKYHCGPLVRRQVHGGHMVNGVLAQFQLKMRLVNPKFILRLYLIGSVTFCMTSQWHRQN